MSLKIYQGLNLDYPQNADNIDSSTDIRVDGRQLYVETYVLNSKKYSVLNTNSKTITGAINEVNLKPNVPLQSSVEILVKDNKAFINDYVFQTNTYLQLQTTNKTIFGSINECNLKTDNNNHSILDLREVKQNVQDLALTTTSKKITGAINEINNKVSNPITVDQQSFSLINNFLTLDDPAVSKRFNNTITYDTMDTLDKTITGGINEVVTKTYNLDINKQDKLIDSDDMTISNSKINLIQKKSYFVSYNLNPTIMRPNNPASSGIRTGWHLSITLYPTNKAIDGLIVHFSNTTSNYIESGTGVLTDLGNNTDLTTDFIRVTQNIDGTTSAPKLIVGKWNDVAAGNRLIVNLAFITVAKTIGLNDVILSFWDVNPTLTPVNLTLNFRE